MIGISLITLVMPATSGISAETPQYGGILKIVDMAEGAQPIGVPWENQTIDTKLMPPVIETLLMEDVSGKVSPHLAKKYNVDLENKTITFWLHEGIKFHDGTDFNAEAAKWCIEKAIEGKVARGWDSVEVVDDYTVRIHFENYRNDYLNRDAMVAVQRNLEDVGIQAELEFPDMGGYMNYRFQGWHNGFMVHHTRALANFNLTFSIYFLPNYKQFPSLQRTDGLIPAIEASNYTPEPSKEKGQPLTRIIDDDVMVIPLYYVYELYVLRSNVHDTGYTKWSGSSVFSPENVWLSAENPQ